MTAAKLKPETFNGHYKEAPVAIDGSVTNDFASVSQKHPDLFEAPMCVFACRQ